MAALRRRVDRSQEMDLAAAPMGHSDVPLQLTNRPASLIQRGKPVLHDDGRFQRQCDRMASVVGSPTLLVRQTHVS